MAASSSIEAYQNEISISELKKLDFDQNETGFLHSCIPEPSLAEELLYFKEAWLPTPPRSPAHETAGVCEGKNDIYRLTNKYLRDVKQEHSDDDLDSPFIDSSFIDSTFSFDDATTTPCSVDSTRSSFPDLKDACSEFFDCNSNYELIGKDCMWNGAGHQPLPRTLLSTQSGAATRATANPVEGCVNPRSVFVYAPTTLETGKPFPLARGEDFVDGMETPSDSEEEIDVVTVEKIIAPETQGPVKTINMLPRGQKLFGTFVSSQEDGQRHLKLYAPPETSRFILQGKGGKEQIRSGRINFHLKGVSIREKVAGLAKATVKRRWTSTADCNAEKNKITSVLCSSNTPHLNMMKENTAPNLIHFSPTKKKRILSLDGVSMVTNTGVMQNCSYRKSVKVEKPEVKTLCPLQVSKNGNGCSEKKKTTKKLSKTKLASNHAAYETPTNSPGSTDGDLPTPRKRIETNSGSDEEGIRRAHNVLERQRREGLRTSFNLLRLSIPDLVEQERTPKVTILKKAREFVLQLGEEKENLQVQKTTEQQRNAVLHKRICELENRLQRKSTVYTSVKSRSIKSELLRNYRNTQMHPLYLE